MRYVFIFICTLLTSCSIHPSGNNLSNSNYPDNQPYKIDVLEEFNDGENLFLVVGVESAQELGQNNLLFKLSTSQAGEIKHVAYYPLSTKNKNESGQVVISMRIPSQQMSDYQLELLWGSDVGRNELNKTNSAGIVLRNVKIEREAKNCKVQTCDIYYHFSAELYNASKLTVDQAQLGVSFVWAGSAGREKFSANIPENEQIFDLPNLALMPGNNRRIKINLEKPINEGLSPSQTLQPMLRIVSFK